ncbi:hypothetical protein [Sulfuriferula nivalis]|uniref:DUF4424 domain-containing protein n=1 Tax=Sulfuriferula nivalis TaxID=2675298 RepID=A0A809SAQ3_9PROT|nr:hypothetical protein [Sulfuriferula nivalis]BBP01782.1 hypothetical protein SFSGTM_24900 [Sulfuriferula nivalis]
MRYKLIILGMMLSVHAWAATMTELDYQDSDAGTPAYRTRILVTPDFLRMDTGIDADNFALLYRATGKLYNVSRDDHQVYLYDTQAPKITLPKPWKITQHVTQINTSTHRFDWAVNGNHCGEITATSKLQADTAVALQQYWRALALSQWKTWQRTPDDVRNQCDLARYVVAIPFVFQYGLPLSDEASDGRSRHYQSDSVVPLRAELFVLPADYKVIKVQ